MKEFKIGQKVTRLGSSKDYTTGRTGIVVEIKDPRIRVRWLYDSDGEPITIMNAKAGNGVRTWVNKKFLAIIFVTLFLLSCAAPIIPYRMWYEWDGTYKQWKQFENCVDSIYTDQRCDSCYRKVMHKFPEP